MGQTELISVHRARPSGASVVVTFPSLTFNLRSASRESRIRVLASIRRVARRLYCIWRRQTAILMCQWWAGVCRTDYTRTCDALEWRNRTHGAWRR